MTNRFGQSRVDRLLGVVGLFLVILVSGLAERGYSPQRTFTGRAWALLSRRTIDAAAVIGWLADRLPSSQERFQRVAHVARTRTVSSAPAR